MAIQMATFCLCFQCLLPYGSLLKNLPLSRDYLWWSYTTCALNPSYGLLIHSSIHNIWTGSWKQLCQHWVLENGTYIQVLLSINWLCTVAGFLIPEDLEDREDCGDKQVSDLSPGSGVNTRALTIHLQNGLRLFMFLGSTLTRGIDRCQGMQIIVEWWMRRYTMQPVESFSFHAFVLG